MKNILDISSIALPTTAAMENHIATPPRSNTPISNVTASPLPAANDNNEINSQTSRDVMTSELKKTPLGLGMTFGYVKSLADGATLNESVRDYYLQLVESINRAWWELSRETVENEPWVDGIIDVYIARDGSIVNRRLRSGTGSGTIDRLLLKAVDSTAPFPKLPEDYPLDIFMAPLRIVKPLYLFR